jgi:lysine 6-dehydrogenase
MKYLLLGSGLQGTAIAFDLLRQASGTEELIVYDQGRESLDRLRQRFPDQRLRTVAGDVRDRARLEPLMKETGTVISAVNYWYNADLAALAIACGAHFLDLGGNNSIVERELALDARARAKRVTVIPDCGLAPGMAGIIGYHLQGQLDRCDSLKLRVGGLPQHPRPPLDYMLVFSVQGLINEYVEPAVVIRDGKTATVPSLTEIEELQFPEPYGRLEAFQTSGGTSTLPATLAGRVRNLDYKTIRYPGHCARFRTLVDLGLCDSKTLTFGGADFAPREFLAMLLERTLTLPDQDVVLVHIEAEGTADGRRLRRLCRIIDLFDTENGISAMMRTTGYPAAIIAQMLASGTITERGARPQELVVPAEPFLAELTRRGIRTEFSEMVVD